jgi:hypothetical protein
MSSTKSELTQHKIKMCIKLKDTKHETKTITIKQTIT